MQIKLLTMDARQITITCHEHMVPPFVEAALERLYGNIFSSMLQHRSYGLQAHQMNTYVERSGDELVAVFLFLRDANKVVVLNEGITINGAGLGRFCSYIFATYAAVNVICFKAIQTDVRNLPFPHQRVNYLDDLVLALPATVEDYMDRLAANTRRNIRRYMERLRRDFPSFQFNLHIKTELDEQEIRSLVAFNSVQLARRNIASAIDEQEAQRIVRIVRACGAIGAISIDGRVRAGAVCYRSGENYFLNVLAHDPHFDGYGLDILCCYLTICECIRRGGKQIHFLCGRSGYKETFLAERRDLDCVAVYRSPQHLLLNAHVVIHLAIDGCVRKANVGLRHGKNLASSLVLAVEKWLHRANRGIARSIRLRSRMLW